MVREILAMKPSPEAIMADIARIAAGARERIAWWRVAAGLTLYGAVAGKRGRDAMLRMGDAALRDRAAHLAGDDA